MLKKILQKNKRTQSGFTILVAVVTAGVLLIVAMSIGGIALKEQVLSSANKDSQVAYYAADSGMECALYWDQKKGKFGPFFDDAGTSQTSPTTLSFNCNGQSVTGVTLSTTVGNPQLYSYSFMINGLKVGDGTGPTTCAVVMITKETGRTGVDGQGRSYNPNQTYTKINSYGYNTCDPSPRRLERGIEATYP